MGGQVFESEDEVSLVDPKESNVGDDLLEDVLKAVRDQDEADEQPLEDDEEDDQEKADVLVDEALWQQVVYHKPVARCQDSKDELANGELLSLHIDLSLNCFGLVTNRVEVLGQVVFDNAPDRRNRRDDRHKHADDEPAHQCSKGGRDFVFVAKEALKDFSDSLKDQICEWICDEVGKEHVLQRAREQIDDDEEFVGAHDLQECKVEVFPFDAHQEHVVHHDDAEDEQRDDDQLEHDADEHAHVAEVDEVGSDRHPGVHREKPNFLEHLLAEVGQVVVGHLVVGVGVDLDSIGKVDGRFSCELPQVKVG